MTTTPDLKKLAEVTGHTFSFDVDGCGELIYGKTSHWVRYSDYAALQQEVERLTFDRDAKSKRMWELGHECERLQQEVETLRAELGKFSERNVYALRQQLAHARQEVETLRGAIDCACNALTDSICVSGNDAETNLRWVKKLRAQQHTGEVPGYVRVPKNKLQGWIDALRHRNLGMDYVLLEMEEVAEDGETKP